MIAEIAASNGLLKRLILCRVVLLLRLCSHAVILSKSLVLGLRCTQPFSEELLLQKLRVVGVSIARQGVPASQAAQRLLGNAASRVSMSSTKSSIGHLLGAAGAVEAIFSVLAIRDNVAPPTINLDNPSVETPIDLVPHQARKREINTALSNSFGFGGTNASVIFRRYVA